MLLGSADCHLLTAKVREIERLQDTSLTPKKTRW